MAFAGPGDPTGKGRGFSFVKDTRKVSLLIKAISAFTSSHSCRHCHACCSTTKGKSHFKRMSSNKYTILMTYIILMNVL